MIDHVHTLDVEMYKYGHNYIVTIYIYYRRIFVEHHFLAFVCTSGAYILN